MEIVVASGKGGTGKTFVSSNLSLFLREKCKTVVSVDADVEAPDLLIALGGPKKILWSREIFESQKARIDYFKCTLCGECLNVCTFYALRRKNDKIFIIPEFCEGCGACKYVCPEKAISLYTTSTGRLYAAISMADIPVVTGDLNIGERNMGHVVYEAKESAKELARDFQSKYIVVDAAPGIGCTVISSLAGADVLLVVSEPTTPSLKGAKRLVELSKHFNIRIFGMVNKYDLNETLSDRVDKILNIPILGKIRYDALVVESYTQMIPLLKYKPRSSIACELSGIFERFLELIDYG